MQQRRTGEDVDSTLVVGQQGQLGEVEEGRDVEVVGRLRDRPAGVPVDAPRPVARLVHEADGGGQHGIAHPGSVCGSHQGSGRGAEHVLAHQRPSQRVEQGRDAQQREDEQKRRPAQHDDGTSYLALCRVCEEEQG